MYRNGGKRIEIVGVAEVVESVVGGELLGVHFGSKGHDGKISISALGNHIQIMDQSLL